MVERYLAKVEVVGSNPTYRSLIKQPMSLIHLPTNTFPITINTNGTSTFPLTVDANQVIPSPSNSTLNRTLRTLLLIKAKQLKYKYYRKFLELSFIDNEYFLLTKFFIENRQYFTVSTKLTSSTETASWVDNHYMDTNTLPLYDYDLTENKYNFYDKLW